jgi:hypothetical protein
MSNVGKIGTLHEGQKSIAFGRINKQEISDIF